MIKTLVLVVLILGITSCTESTKNQKQEMKKVLIIGMDPHTIDFSNPEIPVGLTAEKILAGTKVTLENLREAGYDAELFLISTGAANLNELPKQLVAKNYDGVLIGNGIRGLKVNFILFEQLINLVHENARNAKIIFNTTPADNEVAIKRWL